MAREISEYLARTVPAGVGKRDETWEAVAFADRAMMDAIRAWERGEISYADLEAAGLKYVEAWEGLAGDCS
jgi:hypothetical protein